MTREEAFMSRAIKRASENVRSGRGGPFAALVVSGDRIIAEGTNLVTSTNDPTAHAEIVAIRAACGVLKSFQLTGCEIITSCEPCPMCLGAIYWAHPAAVFFSATHLDAANAGFDHGFIYQQLRHTASRQTIPMQQVLASEAVEPFRVWAEYDRRIPY